MFRPSATIASSFIIVLIALSGLVAAGCTGMNQTATSSSTPTTVTVNILGNRFDTQQLTIPPGSTVIWHNTTSVEHPILCDSEFNAALRPGQDFNHTFNNGGYFVVYSERYPNSPGLTMEIRVE